MNIKQRTIYHITCGNNLKVCSRRDQKVGAQFSIKNELTRNEVEITGSSADKVAEALLKLIVLNEEDFADERNRSRIPTT